jgi:hypothetical protein
MRHACPRTLPRLVFAHLSCDLIELCPVSQLLQGFLFLAVFLAQNVPHVDAGGWLELGFAVGFAIASGVFALAFVLGRHVGQRRFVDGLLLATGL